MTLEQSPLIKLEPAMPSLDELRETDRLLASINGRLDAMFTKLAKVAVAAETVKELLGDVDGREAAEPQEGRSGTEEQPAQQAGTAALNGADRR
jgi:hypothetical protein